MFVWAFAVEAGVPAPVLPMLLGAGAVSGSGQINFALGIVAAMAAALGADLPWYGLGITASAVPSALTGSCAWCSKVGDRCRCPRWHLHHLGARSERGCRGGGSHAWTYPQHPGFSARWQARSRGPPFGRHGVGGHRVAGACNGRVGMRFVENVNESECWRQRTADGCCSSAARTAVAPATCD